MLNKGEIRTLVFFVAIAVVNGKVLRFFSTLFLLLLLVWVKNVVLTTIETVLKFLLLFKEIFVDTLVRM